MQRFCPASGKLAVVDRAIAWSVFPVNQRAAHEVSGAFESNPGLLRAQLFDYNHPREAIVDHWHQKMLQIMNVFGIFRRRLNPQMPWAHRSVLRKLCIRPLVLCCDSSVLPRSQPFWFRASLLAEAMSQSSSASVTPNFSQLIGSQPFRSMGHKPRWRDQRQRDRRSDRGPGCVRSRRGRDGHRAASDSSQDVRSENAHAHAGFFLQHWDDRSPVGKALDESFDSRAQAGAIPPHDHVCFQPPVGR